MKNQARWFGGSYRLINLAMCRSHEVGSKSQPELMGDDTILKC